MKHAPGPWKLVGYAGHLNIEQDHDVIKHMPVIASTTNVSERGYANARLIAAAPDMLEALKDAIENHEHGGIWRCHVIEILKGLEA